MSDFLIEDDEFKGSVPEIEVRESRPKNYFHYKCVSTGNNLGSPCTINSEPYEICYDCLGHNRKFIHFYTENCHCSGCNTCVDFGYFIIVYLLDKAGLLPKNFKLICCCCASFEKRIVENIRQEITEIGIEDLLEELEDGEER